MDEHAKNLDETPVARLNKVVTGIVETKKRRPIGEVLAASDRRQLAAAVDSETLDQVEAAVRNLPTAKPEANSATAEQVLQQFAGPRYRPGEIAASQAMAEYQAAPPTATEKQPSSGVQPADHYRGAMAAIAEEAMRPKLAAPGGGVISHKAAPAEDPVRTLPPAPVLEPRPDAELPDALLHRRLIDTQIEPVIAQLRDLQTELEISIAFLEAQRRRWYSASDVMAADLTRAKRLGNMCAEAILEQRKGLEPPTMAQMPQDAPGSLTAVEPTWQEGEPIKPASGDPEAAA